MERVIGLVAQYVAHNELERNLEFRVSWRRLDSLQKLESSLFRHDVDQRGSLQGWDRGHCSRLLLGRSASPALKPPPYDPDAHQAEE